MKPLPTIIGVLLIAFAVMLLGVIPEPHSALVKTHYLTVSFAAVGALLIWIGRRKK